MRGNDQRTRHCRTVVQAIKQPSPALGADIAHPLITMLL